MWSDDLDDRGEKPEPNPVPVLQLLPGTGHQAGAVDQRAVRAAGILDLEAPGAGSSEHDGVARRRRRVIELEVELDSRPLPADAVFALVDRPEATERVCVVADDETREHAGRSLRDQLRVLRGH